MTRDEIIEQAARQIGALTCRRFAEHMTVHSLKGDISNRIRNALEAYDRECHTVELAAALQEIEKGADDPRAVAKKALDLLPGRQPKVRLLDIKQGSERS